MQLENDLPLLRLKLDFELCKDLLKVLDLDQTAVFFVRIDVHVLEELLPVLRIVSVDLLLNVLVQP